MMHRFWSKVLVLAVFGGVGVALTPGCDVLDLGGDGGAGGGTEDLQSVDPDELARVELTGNDAAYVLAGLIEQNAGDPATVDEAIADQLVAQYAPQAWDQAQQWVASLDPSAIPAA